MCVVHHSEQDSTGLECSVNPSCAVEDLAFSGKRAEIPCKKLSGRCRTDCERKLLGHDSHGSNRVMFFDLYMQ